MILRNLTAREAVVLAVGPFLVVGLALLIRAAILPGLLATLAAVGVLAIVRAVNRRRDPQRNKRPPDDS
jgi:hypothetical protein